jgi:hypothetical protein
MSGSTAGVACAWICRAVPSAGARPTAAGESAMGAAGSTACHGHSAAGKGLAFDQACCRPVTASTDAVGPDSIACSVGALVLTSRRVAAPTLLDPGPMAARRGLSGGPPGPAGPSSLRI